MAEIGQLVTFEIYPTHPETGETVAGGFKTNAFVEKPDRKVAETYIEIREYYWNVSIFMFGTRQYLEELQKRRTENMAACGDF